MRALLQRASRAEVRVDGERVARIGRGLVVFLGVGRGDGRAQAQQLAKKIAKLRIFEDAEGRMNESLLGTAGEALVVSQFTLYADTSRGNRPGFGPAAPPEEADALYGAFTEGLRGQGVPVRTGVFGAAMEVDLVNEGPVTLWLEAPPDAARAGGG